MRIKSHKKDNKVEETRIAVPADKITPPIKSAHVFIIKKQRVSEKSNLYKNQNKYVFEVNLKANKNQIKEAIKKRYGIKVLSLNTTIIKGKRKTWRNKVGHRPSLKKAIVTLKAGDKIEEL